MPSSGLWKQAKRAENGYVMNHVAGGVAHALERAVEASEARIAKRSFHRSERRAGCPERTSGDGARATPTHAKTSVDASNSF